MVVQPVYTVYRHMLGACTHSKTVLLFSNSWWTSNAAHLEAINGVWGAYVVLHQARLVLLDAAGLRNQPDASTSGRCQGLHSQARPLLSSTQGAQM